MSDRERAAFNRFQEQQLAAQATHAAYERSYRHAAGRREAARRDKPMWKRLLSVPTDEERQAAAQALIARQRATRAYQGAQAASRRLQQQHAAMWGQPGLIRGLAALSDDWVMLRGYQNRRGRADHVLVGPKGIWAVAVNRNPIRLHAVGDQWWYDRLDPAGAVVQTAWASDRLGRCWAAQINEVADDLADWLRRNGEHIPVLTAIMLTHPQAQVAICEKTTVDLLGLSPRELLDAAVNRSGRLLPETRHTVVRLIERDHRHYENHQRQTGH